MHDIAIDDVTLDLVDRRFETLLGKARDKIGFDHIAAFHIHMRRRGSIQLFDQLIDADLRFVIGITVGRVGVHNEIQLAA